MSDSEADVTNKLRGLSQNMSMRVFSVEQLKDKFLICTVCMEEYDEEDKHPRLLPCLHTFCFKCVQSLYKKGIIECPNCRTSHAVEFEDFRDIPKDNTRRDLMDFVVVKKSSSNISCQSCGAPGSKVVCRCKECAEFLCEQCRDAHKRTNKTKSHILMTIEELRSKETLEAFCHPTKCEEHDQNLTFYCSKNSCELPVCINCALVHHKENLGHEIQDVNTVCKQKMSTVNKLMSQLDNVGIKVSKSIKVVNAEIKNVAEKEKDLEEEINSAFDNYITALNNRRGKMLSTMKASIAKKDENLCNQKSSLEKHKESIEKALEFSDQSLAYTNPPAFLQIEKIIIARLKELLETPFDSTPHETATVGFRQVGMMTELQRAANFHTRIWSLSIYPPKTKIEMQGRCVVKEVITFYIAFRKHDGTLSEDGHGLVEATILASDNSEAKIRVDDPNQASNGMFRASFVPMQEGYHCLEVTIASVKSGKFEFEVMAEDNHTVSNMDDRILKTAILKEFCFDSIKCHKDVTVTPDGKTFLNSPTQMDNVNSNAFQKYKGVMGDTPLFGPGRFYYELSLRYTVRRPLEKSNLVFEMGLAQKSAIDNKIHVDGQANAWSMIGAHHAECDAICLHIAHKKTCVFHDRLSKNEPEESVFRTFGFLLDTDKGELSIFACEKPEVVSTLKDINCTEPLFPVVAGYNPYQIEVNITLRTGESIKGRALSSDRED